MRAERRASHAEPRDPPVSTRGHWWALVGLAAILVITAAWWGLALWPLPADTPEWVLRTRLACFGSGRDSLPNPGGWALLVGQPLSMLAFLLAVWGDAVQRGLEALWRVWPGRLGLGASVGLLLWGATAAWARVAEVRGEPFDAASGTLRPTRPVELGGAAPGLALVDQRGLEVRLEDYRERIVLVTFAYAHCETVCPSLVRNAVRVVEQTRPRPVLLIVTLDPRRDTPSRLPGMAAGWGLPREAHVLGGAVDAVEHVLNAWKVPRIRNQATGELIHPALTYIVAPGGRLAWMTDGSVASLTEGIARLQ